MVIQLDPASFLLQWAVGGLGFLWVTTRHREVGLGYGWISRAVFLVLILSSVAVSQAVGVVVGRDVAAAAAAMCVIVALAVSVRRRGAGVAGQRAGQERRSARVAAMTGIDRAEVTYDVDQPEYPPWLDLLAPAVGAVGLVFAGFDAGGNGALATARLLVGAAFLGSVTCAMLLGHWYLVQPGLTRARLLELVHWTIWMWPLEVAVLLIPTGMVSVLNGSIDDGYGGILGWMWVTCAVTTIGLVLVTRAALRERAYSAVMAATGLLYLAILTAFGTDLVARAVLS